MAGMVVLVDFSCNGLKSMVASVFAFFGSKVEWLIELAKTVAQVV